MRFNRRLVRRNVLEIKRVIDSEMEWQRERERETVSRDSKREGETSSSSNEIGGWRSKFHTIWSIWKARQQPASALHYRPPASYFNRGRYGPISMWVIEQYSTVDGLTRCICFLSFRGFKITYWKSMDLGAGWIMLFDVIEVWRIV